MTAIIRSRKSTTYGVAATLVWSTLRDDGDVRILVRRRDAAKVWAAPRDWWRILDASRRVAYSVERAFAAADGSVRIDARRVNLHKNEAPMVLRCPGV